jgi:hypothetical protein
VECFVYGMTTRNIVVFRTIEGEAGYFDFPQLFRKTGIEHFILEMPQGFAMQILAAKQEQGGQSLPASDCFKRKML